MEEVEQADCRSKQNDRIETKTLILMPKKRFSTE
jgi:hypothetical protein